MILEMPRSDSVWVLAPWNAAGILQRADADDRALPGHQPRHRVVGADAARVGQRDRRARIVLRGQRAGPGLADDLLVAAPELGEAHRLGALDRHHDEVAAAALARQVDRQAEVDVRRGDDRRLAVDHREVPVHARVIGDRPDDGVADQVGERDLPAAVPLQEVVDHDPVVGHQLRRHRAHRGGGRHLQRGRHVLHHGRRRAAHRCGGLAGTLRVLGGPGGLRRLDRDHVVGGGGDRRAGRTVSSPAAHPDPSCRRRRWWAAARST